MRHLEPSKFVMVGNNLSLDYVNTKIVVQGQEKDLLEHSEDLLAWAVAANLVSLRRGNELLRSWQPQGISRQVFQYGLRFREILLTMIRELQRRHVVKPSVIAAINAMLRRQNGYAELRPTEEGFAKYFRASFLEPSQLFAPIAEAAADLLCYGNPSYIKKCENPDCVLFFYDMTKNHSRRWCSMAACGNRAKAAAFYQRQSRKSANRQRIKRTV